jgi:hypothetical protein
VDGDRNIGTIQEAVSDRYATVATFAGLKDGLIKSLAVCAVQLKTQRTKSKKEYLGTPHSK